MGRQLELKDMAAAVKMGAARAGWRTESVSDDQILAIYKFRNHRAIVTIDFSLDTYSIIYRNSLNMKVVCSADSLLLAQSASAYVVTTGEDPCPNAATPEYIHEKYNEWVEQLDDSIYWAVRTWPL